jgi:hypothetical protein
MDDVTFGAFTTHAATTLSQPVAVAAAPHQSFAEDDDDEDFADFSSAGAMSASPSPSAPIVSPLSAAPVATPSPNAHAFTVTAARPSATDVAWTRLQELVAALPDLSFLHQPVATK